MFYNVIFGAFVLLGGSLIRNSVKLVTCQITPGVHSDRALPSHFILYGGFSKFNTGLAQTLWLCSPGEVLLYGFSRRRSVNTGLARTLWLYSPGKVLL